MDPSKPAYKTNENVGLLYRFLDSITLYLYLITKLCNETIAVGDEKKGSL